MAAVRLVKVFSPIGKVVTVVRRMINKRERGSEEKVKLESGFIVVVAVAMAMAKK